MIVDTGGVKSAEGQLKQQPDVVDELDALQSVGVFPRGGVGALGRVGAAGAGVDVGGGGGGEGRVVGAEVAA